MKVFYYIACVLCIIFYACNSTDSSADENSADNSTASAIKKINFSIIKTYPHDTSLFTQGLVFNRGILYEGTGGASYAREGKPSAILQLNLQTGKPEKTHTLEDKYFGEGITILHDTLYQLTWREKVVFVYSLPDMKKIKEFPINTEGWGITTDGKDLIVSDGTSNIYFYDPTTFQLLRTQSVTEDGNLVDSINELEFINGYLYANRWTYPYIYKIDLNGGIVLAHIDVTEIWDRLKQRGLADNDKVPNGIAYDSTTNKIYITGKKWPELYEIQLAK